MVFPSPRWTLSSPPIREAQFLYQASRGSKVIRPSCSEFLRPLIIWASYGFRAVEEGCGDLAVQQRFSKPAYLCSSTSSFILIRSWSIRTTRTVLSLKVISRALPASSQPVHVPKTGSARYSADVEFFEALPGLRGGGGLIIRPGRHRRCRAGLFLTGRCYKRIESLFLDVRR
jgi:hypothetical protein